MPPYVFDVRALLARDEKPRAAILAAWDRVPPGQGLVVVADFEPKPLAALFSAQGVPVHCVQVSPAEYHLNIGPKPC